MYKLEHPLTLTPDEKEKVDRALEKIAAGGIHKKDVRAKIRESVDRAEKIKEHIQYYGPYGKRLQKPIIRQAHVVVPPRKREWLEARAEHYLKEIAVLERKADLYRFVLANGDFPKGYRR